MKETIVQMRQRLCANCKRLPKHIWQSPVGEDEKGNIIFKKHNSKCPFIPRTEEGKDCPYFNPG